VPHADDFCRSSNRLDALDISEPTLLLDVDRARANIADMAESARRGGIRLRPHFKTIQSAAIGLWFREVGVTAATVSSLAMARYFADHGWDDLTLAMLVNPRAARRLSRLAERVRLGVLVDRVEVIDQLAATLAGTPATVWIKIDTGYGRTGASWQNTGRIIDIVRRIERSETLSFGGLLTHAGHAYHVQGAEAVQEIHDQTVGRLQTVRASLVADGLPGGELSVGDTPTCCVVADLSAVDEIRPGNFVFHDLMQLAIGSCRTDQLAVAVACPVVGVYPRRGQVVVHGGAVHLGKETLAGPDGEPVFGYLCGWRDGSFGPPRFEYPVVSLSQEHGVIAVDETFLSGTRIGDVVTVLPVHSCLTCNLYAQYITLEGECLARRR